MEVELQFVYRGDKQPSVPTELAGLILAGSDSFTVNDTYFDSERLDLRRAGCTLRVRIDERRPSPLLAWKGPSKRRRSRKERKEVEFPILAMPEAPSELDEVLHRHGIHRLVLKTTGLAVSLQPIGQLENKRSRHTYVQGLHRLELTWDRLSFPTGPDEIRVEVEVQSPHAERYLDRADAELDELFGDDLRPAARGKVRELCERLYPELMANGNGRPG